MTSTNSFSAFFGTYAGSGNWTDATGQSKPYRIDMKIAAGPDGSVEQWYKHVFFQEGDAVIEQALLLRPAEHGLLDFADPTGQLTGRGYFGDRAFHILMPIPGNAVEVTYTATRSGDLEIVGSSEKNSEGNFIWWQESLKRSG